MKKELKQVLVIPLITFMGFIVNAIFPPSTGSSQQLPPDKQQGQDTTMNLKEAKQVIQNAQRNADVVKGMEAAKKSDAKNIDKPAPQVITKVIFREVVKTRVDTIYKDSVFVSNGVGVEKPIIVYQVAPVYNPEEIKYLTFSQWRDSTGLKSEKKYKQYLKTKFK
ncbi:hypothetical protein ACTJIJ_19975 [Niabella sp. 22666]|uniref:hypothetical protein n=1 Tax=Niabella sp. 22666 TaxID=3453954 RepID=UPI003F85F32C